MRQSAITRKTAETQISVEINLDGTGVYDNQTGVGFFDHMLDQLSRHALISAPKGGMGLGISHHPLPKLEPCGLRNVRYRTLPSDNTV